MVNTWIGYCCDSVLINIISVQLGYEKIAQLLISSGANVNAITVFYRTPLHWASINDSEDIASLLIKSGAAIDAVDYEGSSSNHDYFDSIINFN